MTPACPGLETIVAALSADRARPVGNAADGGAVNTIDDLFSQHDTAIVLTEEGRKDEAFPELAASHDDWANVVNISAAEQLVISRELPFPQVPDWVWAKIAVFNRYPDGEGHRLRMMATERDQASDYLAGERDRIVNGLAKSQQPEPDGAAGIADLRNGHPQNAGSAEGQLPKRCWSREGKAKEDDSPSAAENMVTRQRIYLLQDQLDEANFTIEELKERLALYESYDQGDDADEAGGNDAPETEEARENNVLTAIADPARFPRLRFLTNCAKPLADFGKRRPNGGEIVAALDAINTLAQTWFDTPGGSIGNWDNYFTPPQARLDPRQRRVQLHDVPLRRQALLQRPGPAPPGDHRAASDLPRLRQRLADLLRPGRCDRELHRGLHRGAPALRHQPLVTAATARPALIFLD